MNGKLIGLFNPRMRTAAIVALMLMSSLEVSVAASSDTYAEQSVRASKTLLLDIVHAGPRLVAVGDRGHILFSDDQGRAWSQAKVPTRQLITSVFFSDAQHGWAVGHDSQILASTDGGANWHKQFADPGREAPLLDVWFKDAHSGFAVGAYGQFMSTTDGGEHWSDVSARLDNEDQNHLNAIASVKGAGLVIVGEQGSLFRSNDEGVTWERLQSPYEGSLFGVLGTDQARTLLVYGLRGNLFRSTDFGESWEKIAVSDGASPMEYSLAGASLLGDGTLVLVGNGGVILCSSDAGQSFRVFNRRDRVSLSAITAGGNGTLVLVGQGGIRITDATGSDLGLQVGQK